MKLSLAQRLILEYFINADAWFYYNYGWLENDIDWSDYNIDASRKFLQNEIKGLRSLGLVEYMKGLMDDDGQVAGSGFNIPYAKRKEVEMLLSPHPKKEEER